MTCHGNYWDAQSLYKATELDANSFMLCRWVVVSATMLQGRCLNEVTSTERVD